MLLQEVKEYLKITWDDEDNHLSNMIERGKNYLQDLTGTDLYFEQQTTEKGLLLDYCRYAYNNATEYFQPNYKSEILLLQLREGIKDLPEEEDVS